MSEWALDINMPLNVLRFTMFLHPVIPGRPYKPHHDQYLIRAWRCSNLKHSHTPVNQPSVTYCEGIIWQSSAALTESSFRRHNTTRAMWEPHLKHRNPDITFSAHGTFPVALVPAMEPPVGWLAN
jgi:hypothetical protein